MTNMDMSEAIGMIAQEKGITEETLLHVLVDALASASPAEPRLCTLIQPYGSTFIALLYGDEYVNGFETLAGYTVVQDATGTWSFAERTAAGRLQRRLHHQHPLHDVWAVASANHDRIAVTPYSTSTVRRVDQPSASRRW